MKYLHKFNYKFIFNDFTLNSLHVESSIISLSFSNKLLNLKYPQIIRVKRFNSINTKKLSSNLDDFDSSSSKTFETRYIYEAKVENSISIKKSKSKNSKKNRKNTNLSVDDLFTVVEKTPVRTAYLNSIALNKIKKKEINNSLEVIEQEIYIDGPCSIQDLSLKLKIPEAQVITYLFLNGFSVTINQVIDQSIAEQVAHHYNFKVVNKINAEEPLTNIIVKHENENSYLKRAPIVTILGHVDHGKTTLLDSILQTNLVNKEDGGITQEISGYEIKWSHNNIKYDLVFLDTPGHQAFSTLRFRSVQVADIVLLVVAADDGLKPQTLEAIKYIFMMNLSYIVVINKIDKLGVDISGIKKELTKYNILSEEMGGTSRIVAVSALKGNNIDILLSEICNLSDDNLLRANPCDLAEGVILESYLDKKKGVISNLIIKNGTLKIGDFIVVDDLYCKVKSLMNWENIDVKHSRPSSFIKCLGFAALPLAGSKFVSVQNEKQAKKLVANLQQKNKFIFNQVVQNNSKFLKQLDLIIKTDTQGSLEAVMSAFSSIPQNKVRIRIIASSSGNISMTDINLALTTNAMLIGFKVDVISSIIPIIKQNNLMLKNFHIIYDLLDFIEEKMLDLVDLDYDKIITGNAMVKTVFDISQGCVAGCIVREGKIKKASYIVVNRNNSIVYEGILTSLKRIKEDVNEVIAQNECGIMCDYDNWEQFDVIKAYDFIPKAKEL